MITVITIIIISRLKEKEASLLTKNAKIIELREKLSEAFEGGVPSTERKIVESIHTTP